MFHIVGEDIFQQSKFHTCKEVNLQNHHLIIAVSFYVQVLNAAHPSKEKQDRKYYFY